jgi:hypothetical protein
MLRLLPASFAGCGLTHLDTAAVDPSLFLAD